MMDKEACLKRIEERLFKEVRNDPYSVWQSENRERKYNDGSELEEDDSFELDPAYWNRRRFAGLNSERQQTWRSPKPLPWKPLEVYDVSIELISESDILE